MPKAVSEVVISEPVRSPVGRFGGVFARLSAADLATTVLLSPVDRTGARILATMAHEMHRRGSRYGLETMCIGGGQGLAAVFEGAQ